MKPRTPRSSRDFLAGLLEFSFVLAALAVLAHSSCTAEDVCVVMLPTYFGGFSNTFFFYLNAAHFAETHGYRLLTPPVLPPAHGADLTFEVIFGAPDNFYLSRESASHIPVLSSISEEGIRLDDVLSAPRSCASEKFGFVPWTNSVAGDAKYSEPSRVCKRLVDYKADYAPHFRSLPATRLFQHRLWSQGITQSCQLSIDNARTAKKVAAALHPRELIHVALHIRQGDVRNDPKQRLFVKYTSTEELWHNADLLIKTLPPHRVILHLLRDKERPRDQVFVRHLESLGFAPDNIHTYTQETLDSLGSFMLMLTVDLLMASGSGFGRSAASLRTGPATARAMRFDDLSPMEDPQQLAVFFNCGFQDHSESVIRHAQQLRSLLESFEPTRNVMEKDGLPGDRPWEDVIRTFRSAPEQFARSHSDGVSPSKATALSNLAHLKWEGKPTTDIPKSTGRHDMHLFQRIPASNLPAVQRPLDVLIITHGGPEATVVQRRFEAEHIKVNRVSSNNLCAIATKTIPTVVYVLEDVDQSFRWMFNNNMTANISTIVNNGERIGRGIDMLRLYVGAPRPLLRLSFHLESWMAAKRFRRIFVSARAIRTCSSVLDGVVDLVQRPKARAMPVSCLKEKDQSSSQNYDWHTSTLLSMHARAQRVLEEIGEVLVLPPGVDGSPFFPGSHEPDPLDDLAGQSHVYVFD